VRRITQENGTEPVLNSAPESNTERLSGASLLNSTTTTSITTTTEQQTQIATAINAKIIKSWTERYPVVAKYCSLEKILKNFNENTKLDKEICSNDRRPQIDGNKLLKTAGYPSADALSIEYIISIRGELADDEIEKLLDLEEKYDDSIKVGYTEAQAKIAETNLENRTARGKLLGELMVKLWAEREVLLLKELLAGEGI
jgi:hypothetical protein